MALFVLMEQAISQFISYLQFEKRRSEHSVLAYKTDLEQFARFIQDTFGEVSPSACTSSIIRSWLADLRDRQIVPRSVNRKLSALRSFFRFMQRRNLIDGNPSATLEALKVGKPLPKFVPEAALAKYFDQAELPQTTEDWHRLLIMRLLYETGIRRAELIGLMIRHIDFGAGNIKVLGKGSKERLIPVGKGLLQLIRQYFQWQETATGCIPEVLLTVEGQPLKPHYVNNMVKQELAGITTVEQKSPHVLRHSFATHLLNNGAEINAIKELMGHASLAATQVYTRNSIEKLKAVFKQAHPKA